MLNKPIQANCVQTIRVDVGGNSAWLWFAVAISYF